MRCQEAGELLLEAEPAELGGLGDSPLAEHLRGCVRCAAVGVGLLEGERVLGEVLAGGWGAGAMGGREAMRGVEAALAEFESRVGEGVADDVGGRLLHRRWRRVAAVGVPLAAAASLALMLAPWRGGTGGEALPLPVMKLAERTPAADVVVPAGRDAVLFRTSNPKITVVWIY